MQVVYRANDGTEFNLKDECQHYELQCNKTRTKDKYINYPELHENVYNHCCIHIGKFPGNNTELFNTAAFIIDNIELLSLMIAADLKPVDKSEEFTAGQTILVRDREFDDWEEKVFVRYEPNDIYRYECESCEDCILPWKYAKSL
jgi:hypothetical protein